MLKSRRLVLNYPLKKEVEQERITLIILHCSQTLLALIAVCCRVRGSGKVKQCVL